MHCPSCIVDLNITERQGVEIDYCPQCRGVWLDRGELDKIIERTALATGTSGRQTPQDIRGSGKHREHHAYDDDEYRGKKKKRGFLGELFEFD